MKIDEVLKKGLKFQTPSGREGRVISVEKDVSVPPIWKNKIQRFGWTVTVVVDDEMINLKFNQLDDLTAIKYNCETSEKWRKK